MKKALIASGALSALVLAGGLSGMVSAQTAADATGLTEEQIIEIALTEVPGEVVEVERERHRGETVFEVKILGADGTESEVLIASDSGEVIKVETEEMDSDDDDHDDDCDDDENDHDEDEVNENEDA